MKTLQKIDIAIEELHDALQKYFEGRFHSALVLAGAAEQLIGGYLRRHGQEPTWTNERAVIKKIASGLKDMRAAAAL